MARLRMTPQQAAQLLGVDPSATTLDVTNAWRAWVKLAHPDAGGDRGHFEALAEARAVLLRAAHRGSAPGVETRDHRTPDQPSDHVPSVEDRPKLRGVCRRPSALALLGYVVMAFAVPLTVLIAPRLSAVVAGFVIGIVAAAGAVTVERTVLRPGADTGHRITMLFLSWVPIVAVLAGAAHAMGADVIGVLPVIVLPFIACIASVNPGAGLWRPIGSSS